MHNKDMSQNRIAIYNILSLILIQGVSFFTAPIFSRLLGTSNYGIYSTYLAWCNILIIILPLCVDSTVCIASNEYTYKERLAYQSSTLSLGILSTLVFSIVILIISCTLSIYIDIDIQLIVCMLIYTLFAFIVNYANARYTFEMQAKKNFILGVATTVLATLISLVLILKIPEEVNYWGRIIGGIISYSLIGTIALIMIYREGKTFIKYDYVSFCLPLAIPVIFHALSNVVLSQADRIMIQKISTSSLAGIYSLAYSFASILIYVYNAMNNSWLPFYYRYLNGGDSVELKKHANSYLWLFTLVSIGFLLVFPEVYKVFADASFHDGLIVIPILIIGLFFMFMYSFAINYEFYIKKTRPMAVITVSAAILNILLNYILIINYAMVGAAIATMFSYIYEFAVHYLYVRRFTDGKYPFSINFYLAPIGVMLISVMFFILFSELAIIRWIIAIIDGSCIAFRIYKNRAIF